MRLFALSTAVGALLVVPAATALAEPSGTPTPTPTVTSSPAPLQVVMDLGSDANGDGTYSSDETSDVALATVPFRFTLRNDDVSPLVITTWLFTIVDGVIPATPTPDPTGMVLAPGSATTFTYSVPEFAPPDRGVVSAWLEVFLDDANDPTRDGSVGHGVTVRTLVPGGTPTPSVTPVTPPDQGVTGGGGQPTELPRTGDPLVGIALGGLGLVVVGVTAVVVGRRRRTS